MILCSHCGQTLSGNDVCCPHCAHFAESGPDTSGSENQEAEVLTTTLETGEWDFEEKVGEQLVAIARFASLAEAGYFAHELTDREKIPATVTPDENFDAISGYWSTWFVLSVSQELEDHAKSVLQQMILDADSQEFEYEHGRQHSQADHEPETLTTIDDEADEFETAFAEEAGEISINWVPILLTLTAGSVAFWVTRKLNEPPLPDRSGVPTGQQLGELWDYLDDDPNPWIQKLENGRGVRQLHIDASHHRFFIREDLDGDGRFERELR